MTGPQIHTLATTTAAPLPAVVETSAAAVAAQAKALVEAKYMVALARPRDWNRVRSNVLAACERPRFAEKARYSKPAGRESIVGPSIRFAEELMRALGNIHADSVVVFDDEERRIVRVTVTDLESNVTIPVDAVIEKTVERNSVRDGQVVLGSRMNSQNKKVYRVRSSDDELMVKQNALVSKAMRNGLVRLTPADLLEEAMEQVEATLKKAAKEAGATDRLVKAFAKLGVSEEHLVAYLGHPTDAITPEEFQQLRGIGEAIKDGETTWETIAKTGAPAPRRGVPNVKDVQQGYGDEPTPKPVETKVINEMPPVPKGPLPDDPYEENLAIDRELADPEE